MSERIRIKAQTPAAKERSVLRVQKIDSVRSMNSPVERILFLQRTIGNQAVQRLMKSGALQAKLRIGAPGDVYEQEADRVAERVMRMAESHVLSKQREYEKEGIQREGEQSVILRKSDENKTMSEPEFKIEFNAGLNELVKGVGEVKKLRVAPDIKTEIGKQVLGTLIGLIPGVGGFAASQMYGFYNMMGIEVPGNNPEIYARAIIEDAIKVHFVLAEDNLIRAHMAKTPEMRDVWKKAAAHHFSWAVYLAESSKAFEKKTKVKTKEEVEEFAIEQMEMFKRLDDAAREHVKLQEGAGKSPW